ncbi:MAG: cupin domain-containing protein [Halobacteriales archaeon]|nr:cupin domain-containing protein [Halobacteriales archaeon]
MDDVTRIGRDSLPEPRGTDDVSRQVVFENDEVILIRSRVGAGVTTGWHHNGERRVYGYVTQGSARLEFGPGGAESIPLDEGDFVYVPPRTVRRVVNPTDTDWIVVISFVGSGPPAVGVDGPEDAGA